MLPFALPFIAASMTLTRRQSNCVQNYTCYVNTIFLLEDLLEERNLELHVRRVQTRKIYIDVSHEMWEFPVLPEKINMKTYL